MSEAQGEMIYKSLEDLMKKCSHFEPAAFPDITPHIWGYCTHLEWPFTIAVFKRSTPGAFLHEKTCEEHKKDFDAWNDGGGA